MLNRKHLNRLGVLRLMGILFLFLTAFDVSSDKSKMLIKNWVLVNIYTPRIEKNFKQSGMSPERREQVIRAWVEGSYINFKADGSYEVSILKSEPDTLFWQLSPNDSTLLVRKYRNDEPKEIDIELLTKKELVIVLPDIDGEYTRLYFKADGELEAADGSN